MIGNVRVPQRDLLRHISVFLDVGFRVSEID